MGSGGMRNEGRSGRMRNGGMKNGRNGSGRKSGKRAGRSISDTRDKIFIRFAT
jgi:hypothetical protein